MPTSIDAGAIGDTLLLGARPLRRAPGHVVPAEPARGAPRPPRATRRAPSPADRLAPRPHAERSAAASVSLIRPVSSIIRSSSSSESRFGEHLPEPLPIELRGRGLSCEEPRGAQGVVGVTELVGRGASRTRRSRSRGAPWRDRSIVMCENEIDRAVLAQRESALRRSRDAKRPLGVFRADERLPRQRAA